MFVFERLLAHDYQTVCYIIKCKDKDIFNFYTQNEQFINEIFNADNTIDKMLDIYSSMWKTNREELPLFYMRDGKKESMIEFKTPALSQCYHFSYQKVMEQAKERIENGKKCWLRVSP